jgi:trehalose 6-phosphate synthase/phosphatase
MDGVRSILVTFVARVPGSIVEEKDSTIAWHYRMADAEQGQRESNELRLHLSHLLSGVPVKIQIGSFVIEILPAGIGKDTIALRALHAAVPGTLFVAAGDDDTDDAIFRTLPPDSITIAVGKRPSAARFSVPGPELLLSFVSAVVSRSNGGAAL